MLIRYSASGRSFEFTKGDIEPLSNTFTVLIGRNGTGKSRLMSSIVNDLRLMHGGGRRTAHAHSSEHERPSGKPELRYVPSKVICISTSPFDKFPAPRWPDGDPYYSYLGLRGLPSMNLGLAYLARITFTLMEAAHTSSQQARSVADVLNYLGYEGSIEIVVELHRMAAELSLSDNPREVITERGGFSLMGGERAPLYQLREVDEVDLKRIVDAIRRLSGGTEGKIGRRRFEVHIRSTGVDAGPPESLGIDDLVLLGYHGLLRVREMRLKKEALAKPLLVNEMSSGEQSVVMSLLGLGSQIRDNALVCIDEPEVCLHPEWQERYVQLISKSFAHHKGCHFIIATHSPQVVAELPNASCYVTQMEDGVARLSAELVHNSIDFQLARVFNAPGFRNEYLSRIALTTFLRVAKTKTFDSESEANFLILNTVYDRLKSFDPLREMIDSLREMRVTYG